MGERFLGSVVTLLLIVPALGTERCENWCENRCSELSGDVRAECAGCGENYACRPGADAFGAVPAQMQMAPHLDFARHIDFAYKELDFGI